MSDHTAAATPLPGAHRAGVLPTARGRWVAARRSCRLPALCLLAVGMLPRAGLGTEAGVARPPLVPRVAGNCYERIVQSQDGRITGHQRIRVRDPIGGPRGAQARIDVVKFETGRREAGSLQVADRFDFKMIGDISQEAQEEEAALQIIGYVGSDSRVALDFIGEPVIYPAGRCTGQRLPAVRLDVSARGGVVDLLGGRAEIRITRRRCRPVEVGDGASPSYVIEAVLRMKMYLLGIPFKKNQYVSRQWVDPERGLVRHVLEDGDGGRQELLLVADSACSPPWAPLDDQ